MANKEEINMKLICFVLLIFVIGTIVEAHSDFVLHHEIGKSTGHLSNDIAFHRSRRDASDSIKEECKQQSSQFLKDLSKIKVDKPYTFLNESKDKLAMAWAGKNDGTLIAVTSRVDLMHGGTAESTVYRSEDFGAHFTDISSLTNVTKTIKISHGVQRNPHDAKKVYLVGDGPWLYTTEDGGQTFNYYALRFTIADQITFHSSPQYADYLLAKDIHKTLYISLDNGKTWKSIHENVDTVYWGILPVPGDKKAANPDTDKTIYISVSTPSSHAYFSLSSTYKLVKSMDGGSQWKEVLTDIVSFERRGRFLYASIVTETSSVISTRHLKFSVDNGNSWREAKLPTIEYDQFYQVMDIEDNMVFMHVDNKDDTGHGTLYTSAGEGIIYSESLQRHLYPNFGSIHDFYKVKSMRGVYITSQMSQDASIHSMITYNRGAEWEKIPRPEGVPCKDEKKECYLQIHGMYSLKRNLNANPPLSEESAPGLILVHGHVADALQKTEPDVFVSSDGGYSWRLALKGPHNYNIGDSGGLLVAVSKSELNPKEIKFSLDEGRCWHSYTFTTKTLNVTGVLTEPEGRSATVMIWGYVSDTLQWEVHVIDFKEVIGRKCGEEDYEPWVEHAVVGVDKDPSQHACLLGQKRTFMRLKKNSWCYNGYLHEQQSNTVICACSKDDYECDYGYFRPGGSQNCVEIPEFKGEYIEICLRGHEEKEISQGYRKIPGDVCSGGFAPTSKKIQLGQTCDESSKADVQFDETLNEVPRVGVSKAVKVIAVIIVIVVLALAAFMGVYFLHKFILLRRHKTEYRYSLLNQGEEGPKPESEDRDDLDSALAASMVKYLDSDEEELTTKVLPPSRRPVSAQNGRVKQKDTKSSAQRDTNPFTSYHDDSDDDMLS